MFPPDASAAWSPPPTTKRRLGAGRDVGFLEGRAGDERSVEATVEARVEGVGRGGVAVPEDVFCSPFARAGVEVGQEDVQLEVELPLRSNAIAAKERDKATSAALSDVRRSARAAAAAARAPLLSASVAAAAAGEAARCVAMGRVSCAPARTRCGSDDVQGTSGHTRVP